jgi:hypothetical protein
MLGRQLSAPTDRPTAFVAREHSPFVNRASDTIFDVVIYVADQIIGHPLETLDKREGED